MILDQKLSAFKRKIRARVGFMLMLLMLVTLYGTIGLHLIEGASLFDSFYMAVITLTTVGFAEAVPLSPQGRLFAISTIFLGVASTSISLAMLTNLLFEETLQEFFKGKKMEKLIKDLKGHFIVCGFGATGRGIVEELKHQHVKVVVIDRADVEDEVVSQGHYFLREDARYDETLIKAGIQNAEGLASTLTEDADNVFVVLTARALAPKLKIVSRFKHDDTEKKLQIAGVDHAISPYRMGGIRLALSLTHPTLGDVLDATSRASSQGTRFSRVFVAPESPVRGKTLREAELRQHSNGALIVAVTDHEDNTVFNPEPDFRLNTAAQFLALGSHEQIQALKKYLGDPTGNHQNPNS